MAVQETASQLSMALKVQEYPTLKVKPEETGVYRKRSCYEPGLLFEPKRAAAFNPEVSTASVE
uniref:Uncharacterized protein n=1 Tax=Oryzias sinensis TaxID=183150 RepID=A0A8C7XRS2_9TELE